MVGHRMSARTVRAMSGPLGSPVIGDEGGALAERFGAGVFPALVTVDDGGRAAAPVPVPGVAHLLDRIRSHRAHSTPPTTG